MTNLVGVSSESVVAPRKRTILIIDDDLNMCASLVGALGSHGFEVDTAHDGRTAVGLMMSGAFGLILIDVMMPGMHGVETLNQIKSANPHAMILIMTGQSQLEGFVSEALWTGVDGVLYKPFDAGDVIDIVERKSEERESMLALDLESYQIDPLVLALVPEEMARKYTLLPLKAESGYLVVAMSDPNNLYAIEDLRVRTSLNVKPIRTSSADIVKAFAVHYQYEEQDEIDRQIERIAPSDRAEKTNAAQRLSAEAVAQTPIAKAVELMVTQAVKDQASDIHMEPEEGQLRIRYRIDGVLHDAMSLPKRVHAAMLLQAGGRTNALRALLKAEQERGPDLLRLANALSALYPKGSEEKRLLDAMLLAMPR